MQNKVQSNALEQQLNLSLPDEALQAESTTSIGWSVGSLKYTQLCGVPNV